MNMLEPTAKKKAFFIFFPPSFISQQWVQGQHFCSQLDQTRWDCSEVPVSEICIGSEAVGLTSQSPEQQHTSYFSERPGQGTWVSGRTQIREQGYLVPEKAGYSIPFPPLWHWNVCYLFCDVLHLPAAFTCRLISSPCAFPPRKWRQCLSS